MKKTVYGLIVLLAIVHQDFWWWDESDLLVFGFVPIGLAYHAGISLVAGILWALVVKYCWPHALDDEDASSTVGSEGAA